MKKAALVLACDDNFIPYTSCVARRIARLASEHFPIFILADGVSDDNRAKALSVCPRIEFLDVSRLLESKPFPNHTAFTRVTYARLMIDELLVGFDQAVYMDSDIAVLGDVTPLVFTKLKAAPVAAAHDLVMYASHRLFASRPITPGAPYFNGGVALYDLKSVKAESIFQRAQQFSFENPERCTYADQDALNHILDGRWQVLDWRWNALSSLMFKLPGHPIVRHVSGHKPWGPNKHSIEPEIIGLWRDDLANSPWPELFKPADGARTKAKNRWLKTKIHELSPGPRGRAARYRRNIARSFREIERTVGQLATPLL